MNAVLQCLYYCPPITEYFLTPDDYNKKKLGLVSKGYYDFVQGLFNGNKNAAKNSKSAIITSDDFFLEMMEKIPRISLFFFYQNCMKN